MKHKCEIDNSIWCEEVDNQFFLYVKDYDQNGNEETIHGYTIEFCPLVDFSLNVASEKTHRNVRCGALNIVETQ